MKNTAQALVKIIGIKVVGVRVVFVRPKDWKNVKLNIGRPDGNLEPYMVGRTSSPWETGVKQRDQCEMLYFQKTQ